MFEDILGPRDVEKTLVFTKAEYLGLTEVASPPDLEVGYIFTEERFKKKYLRDGVALYYEVVSIQKRTADIIVRTATIRG